MNEARIVGIILICVSLMFVFLNEFWYIGIVVAFGGLGLSFGKDFVKQVLIGIIIVSFLFYFFADNRNIFSFILEDTGEYLEGEVFLDNESIGITKGGNINLPRLKHLPYEVKFIGIYNGSKFEAKYDFPEDYEDYGQIPFSVSLSYIKNYSLYLKIEEEYYENLLNDQFSHTEEPHWNHMPLTYNYDEECEKFFPSHITGVGRYEAKIKEALQYINEITNGAVVFVKINSLNPDLMFYCDFDDEIDYYEIFNSDTLAYASPIVYNGTYGNETPLIISAEIHFVSTQDCPLGSLPVTAIHEVGHALGLEHNDYPLVVSDIMNPYEQDCKTASFLKTDLEYLWDIYDPNLNYRPYKTKYNCKKRYYDCLDFLNQRKAQEVLEFCGLDKDIHNLDSDKDGLACENLP